MDEASVFSTISDKWMTLKMWYRCIFIISETQNVDHMVYNNSF